MFFYSRTLLAEGGYFAFMDTIIKKIIIETNNFKNLFPIKFTSFQKLKNFEEEANRSLITFYLLCPSYHIRQKKTISFMNL